MPDAALIVSEVVTNAVLHAGEPVTLRASVSVDVLHVDVDDPSDDLPRICDRPVETGRGLHMLSAVAVDWGVTPGGGQGSGKTIWFELRR